MKIEKLKSDDTKEFKHLMQEAFQCGYESVFGKSNSEILPEKDIDRDLKKPNSHAYAMMDQNAIVGGAIITIDDKTSQGELDFLFVKVGIHGKGIGQQIWQEIEAMYPNIKVWKTCTPYFDRRNIYFYVNKLKFKIVRYFEHEEPNDEQTNHDFEKEGGMFEFKKIMNE